MFSKELVFKKNVKSLSGLKTKKLKKQKTKENDISVIEQTNSFAEIIVNNLLKNYKNEN
jgi:hypothetical protein